MCKLDQGYYGREIEGTYANTQLLLKYTGELVNRKREDESLAFKLRIFLESPNDLSDESHAMLFRLIGGK